MIVAMQEGAEEALIQQVIEHLVKMGFEVQIHRDNYRRTDRGQPPQSECEQPERDPRSGEARAQPLLLEPDVRVLIVPNFSVGANRSTNSTSFFCATSRMAAV